MKRIEGGEGHTSQNRWLLIYDSRCSICVKFKNLAKKWDSGGRILEADLDSPLIQEFAPGFRPRDLPKNFHLILPGGRVCTGEMALPEIFALFPGGSSLAWILRAMPGSRWLMFRALKILAGAR